MNKYQQKKSTGITFYVEGYASNIKAIKNGKETIAKFNFVSDFKGFNSEMLCGKLECNIDDSIKINEYKKYDSSSVFVLDFAIDGFISKSDCHFGIFFEICEENFLIKKFSMVYDY